MVTNHFISGRTVSGRNIHTIVMTGIGAAYIEKANNASVYGIKKMFGNLDDIIPGRTAAEMAVHDFLEEHVIGWNSFDILKARTIDTTGTPCPYKAEIDFVYD